ncbi:Transmembrane amino acid transporter [Blattamonas nauphoetae]|uniref:Transmembrane amino acid transporter n=1 Tax=Blattamonas nauphoetae TaxID=2049346 RepID=A0ABQ9YC43_9EUKA|nr:Transmembrane amino acid transporter [Blattamonas nauphoetae]
MTDSSDGVSIDIVSERKSKKKPAGFVGATVNMVNAVIGAGLLGLPFAFAKAGIVPATIMAVFMCFLSMLTGYYLSYASDATNTYVYGELVGRVFGPMGIMFGSICWFFTCFGYTWAYVVLSGDFLTSFLRCLGVPHDSIWVSRWLLTVLLGFFLFQPLSWFRRVDSLKFTSFFALIAIVYSVIIVIVRYPFPSTPGVDARGPPEAFHASFTIVQTFSSFVFAFGAHPSFPSIHGELREKSMSLMMKVQITGFIICFCLYVACAIFGYLSFTDMFWSAESPGNILSLYPDNDYFSLAARLCTMVSVVTGYPLFIIPCRQALLNTIRVIYDIAKKPKHIKVRNMYDAAPPRPLIPPHWKEKNVCCGLTKHHMTTALIGTALTAIFTILSSFFSQVNFVFGLFGSTAGTLICFIIPALLYQQVRRHPERFVNLNRKNIIEGNTAITAITDEPVGTDTMPKAQQRIVQTTLNPEMADIETGVNLPPQNIGVAPAHSRMGLLQMQSPQIIQTGSGLSAGQLNRTDSLGSGFTGTTTPMPNGDAKNEASVDNPLSTNVESINTTLGEERQQVRSFDDHREGQLGSGGRDDAIEMVPYESRNGGEDDGENPIQRSTDAFPVTEAPAYVSSGVQFSLPDSPENDDKYTARLRYLLTPLPASHWKIWSSFLVVIVGAALGLMSLVMTILYDTPIHKKLGI